MSEMIERVTSAILSKMWNENFDGTDKIQISLIREAAVEAIKIMKEPTDEMVKNGALFDRNDTILEGYNKAKQNARISWQAMIEAALK